MPESYSWLFVESIPLLFDRKKVARQLKVETWLDLTQPLKEVKDENTCSNSLQQIISYVV